MLNYSTYLIETDGSAINNRSGKQLHPVPAPVDSGPSGHWFRQFRFSSTFRFRICYPARRNQRGTMSCVQ